MALTVWVPGVGPEPPRAQRGVTVEVARSTTAPASSRESERLRRGRRDRSATRRHVERHRDAGDRVSARVGDPDRRRGRHEVADEAERVRRRDGGQVRRDRGTPCAVKRVGGTPDVVAVRAFVSGADSDDPGRPPARCPARWCCWLAPVTLPPPDSMAKVTSTLASGWPSPSERQHRGSEPARRCRRSRVCPLPAWATIDAGRSDRDDFGGDVEVERNEDPVDSRERTQRPAPQLGEPAGVGHLLGIR